MDRELATAKEVKVCMRRESKQGAGLWSWPEGRERAPTTGSRHASYSFCFEKYLRVWLHNTSRESRINIGDTVLVNAGPYQAWIEKDWCHKDRDWNGRATWTGEVVNLVSGSEGRFSL